VEIVLSNRRKDVTLARLGPREFFGEVELLRGGLSIASVRAVGKQPVELVALPREGFNRLVSNSPLTQEAIGRIVQFRLEENHTATRRRK